MVSLKERLKAKLGRKAPTTSPSDEVQPAFITPKAQAQARPDPTTSLPSLPERLWNGAYDRAKTSNLSIVSDYEKILSTRLRGQDADGSDPQHWAGLASQKNEIAQNADERRVQMQQLVQHGLHKTEKDAGAKQGIEDGIQAAMVLKEIVDKAVQASPEAAIAWVGVCFALEVGWCCCDEEEIRGTNMCHSDRDEPAYPGEL